MNDDNLQVYSRRPTRQWRSRMGAALSVGFLMLCGAGTYRLSMSVMNWRGSTEVSRRIALDARQPDRARAEAIVALMFDHDATLQALRKLASVDGEVGQHARNALATMGH